MRSASARQRLRPARPRRRLTRPRRPPMRCPTSFEPSTPVVHNRPLPEFDHDNPLGTVEPSPAAWAEQLAELARPEPAAAASPEPPVASAAAELAPAPAVMPLGNEILPSRSGGSSGSFGGLLGHRRRPLFAAVVVVVLVALVAWLLAGRPGSSNKSAPPAAPAAGSGCICSLAEHPADRAQRQPRRRCRQRTCRARLGQSRRCRRPRSVRHPDAGPWLRLDAFRAGAQRRRSERAHRRAV